MHSDSGSSRPVIGHLAEASGTVIAVASDGSKRILESGDALYLHDRVFTEPGHTASIKLLNNQIHQIEDHSRLVLVESMLHDPDSSSNEATTDEEILLPNEEVELETVGQDSREHAKRIWDAVDSNKTSTMDIPRMPVVDHENAQARGYVGADVDPALNTSQFSNLKTLDLRDKEDSVFVGQFQSSGSLTYSLVSPPEAGSLSLTGDGSFRFDPGNDFQYLGAGETVVITFTFETEDDQGNRNQNTVDITVEGENNAPEVSAPVEESLSQQDDVFTVDLLKHAQDKDENDALYVNNLRLVSGNEAGVQVSIDGTGLVVDPKVYRFLAEGETETLSYEYQVSDSIDSVAQTATIILSGTNDAPEVSQAILQTSNEEAGTITVDLLDNAFDLDDLDSLDAVSLTVTAGDPRGVTVSPDGNSLEIDTGAYDHLADGETETIDYNYEIKDDHDARVTQQASITIEGRNDAPEDIALSSNSVSENDAGGIVGTLSTTDRDLSDTHTYTVSDNRFEVVNNQLRLKATESLDHELEDTITISVTSEDSSGSVYTESFTINVNDINEQPASTDSSATINEESLYSFSLSDFAFSDEDDGASLAFIQIDSLPASGLLELNGSPVSAGNQIQLSDISSNNLTFLPDSRESGNNYASFQFRVSDGSLTSDLQTFTFHVTPVASAPSLTLDDSEVISEMGFESGIDDWSASNGVEIHSDGGPIGDARSGDKLAELDKGPGTPVDALSYSVNTLEGHDHELTVWLKQRGSGDHTDDVEIVWNGEVIATFDPGTSWGEYKITLPNTHQATTIVSIREVAAQNDGWGPIIDDISVTRLGAEDSTNPAYDYSISSYEDTPVPLDITSALSDSDGSETLGLSLSGIPSGSVVTDGTNTVTSDGSDLDISNWQRSALRLTPPANSISDFTLTITATATESGNADQASTSKTLRVDLIPVDDAPVANAVDLGSTVEENDFIITETALLANSADIDGDALSITSVTVDNSAHGTLTDNLDGTWTFSPAVDFNGTDITFSFIVSDGTTGDEATGTASLDVTADNDAPVPVDDASSGEATIGGNTITGSSSVLDNDNDVDSASLTVTLVNGIAIAASGTTTVAGTYGDLAIAADGSWTYTPKASLPGNGPANTALIDQFTYTASDGEDTATAVLSVNVNRSPEAQSGTLSATEDGSVVNGNLTSIDRDSGETLSYTKLSDPAEGTVTVNTDGSYQFDPGSDFQDLAAGETRTVTFSYRVEDSAGDSDTAQVSITVTGVNDAPSAIALSNASVNENAAGAVIGQLTVTDTDTSNTHSFSVDDNRFEVVSGQLKLKDGVSLDHESASTVTVNVTATDDQSAQKVQTFTITVSDQNDAPNLTAVTPSITEDTGTQTINLLQGTSDQDGDTLSISNLVKTAGDASGVTINGNTLEIDTAAYQSLGNGDTETLTYTYNVNDGNGGSTPQTATITITGTNDAANITGTVTGSLTEDSDANIDGNLVATGSLGITDADSGEDSFTPDTHSGTYGTLVITSSGQWTYTASNSNSDIQALPDGGTLTDSVTVNALDGTPQTITITISGTNDSASITGTSSGTVAEDTAVNGLGQLTVSNTLTAVDTDTGESSFISGTRTGTYGSLDIQTNGSWTYRALNSQTDIQNLGTGESLTDSITVYSEDSTTQVITITITGTNDAPVITAGGTLAYSEDSGSLAIDNSITLSDIDSDNLNSATITITGGYQSGEDLLGFANQNGITSSWNASTGTLTLSGSATLAHYQAALRAVTYNNSSNTPDTNARTISFKINDGQSDSSVATSTINVTAVNDNPAGGHTSLTLVEDTPYSFIPSDFAFTDAEGSSLQGIKIATLPAKGELLYNGSTATTGMEISRTDLLAGRLTYQAEDEDSGNNYAIFEFRVSDGALYSLPATITFHVTADNDDPTVSSAITESATENDSAFTLNLLQYADDVETPNSLTVSGLTLTSGDSRGVTVTGNTLTIDPDDYDYLTDGQIETIVYSYNIEDAGGDTVAQTATITITGTDDIPAIGGTASGIVTEDSSVDAMGNLTVSNSLTITDADAGESSFTPQTINGSYGSLVITSNGAWTYTADNSQDAIQELDDSETLTESFTVTTADNTSHSITITINGANDAPTVDQGLTNQNAMEETAFSYQIPADAFADRDGETPVLSATLSDGSTLPAWLSFDADSGTFSGTPDDGDSGLITVKVTASDGDLSTSTQFTLTTSAINDPPELSPAPLIDNLVTALNFNTGAGISAVDRSGSGNDAALSGSATWVVDRHSSGSAFFMDGSPGSGELTGVSTGGAMTIATWVRFESFDQLSSRIIDFGNGQASDNIVLSHKGDTGTLSFDIYGSSGVTPHSTLEVTDFFELNEWVHVTATIASDGTLRVYKNGQLAGEVAGTAPTEMVRSGNYLGKSHWGGDGYLDGSLDDFVLVSDTLDAAEVSALYLAGSVDSILADSFHVPENSASSTTVGTVSATDVDSSSLVYSLTDDANGRFEINSNTGEITVSATAVLNKEVEASYDITVEVSDGAQTDTRTYTIRVTDVAETPTVDAPIAASGTDDSGLIQVDLLEGASVVDVGAILSADSVTLTGGNSSGITITGDTLTVDASAYAYLPDGYVETITYSYNILSSTGVSTPQTLTITLTGSNEIAVIAGVDRQSVTEEASATLTATGTLTISDTDTGESSFRVATVSGDYGSLQINALGVWNYSVSNALAAIQELGAGDTLTDTLTVTAKDGTTHSVIITINGTNDAAVIGGVDTGLVIENAAATLTAIGALTISDADAGEDAFTPLTNQQGTYGSLSINALGQWSYSANNSQSALQSLNTGDSLIDTFSVSSVDGETHNIVITIHGTDGDATITGDNTATLTEDESSPNLTASGDLTVTDSDPGESSFTVANNQATTYGQFSINASGHWDYTASNANADIQALASGTNLTDVIIVTSVDGSAHIITITINGTDDAPVIGGVDTGTVTEDDGSTLSVSDQLTITDADSGEDEFTAGTINGTYGDLTIATDGSWTYTADNTQTAIQSLPDGSTLTDTLTVSTADGTTHSIVITINGVNDAAVFSGDDAGSVTEDTAVNGSGNLSASGTLGITDTDTGEALFTAETVNGAYGDLTINAAGSWSYEADNNQSAIQALRADDSLTDTLTVTSDDGSTHTVTITIEGTNDDAVITGTDTGAVTENAAATLRSSGTLVITDTDTGEDSFIAQSDLTGTYGALSITTDGQWSYEADNSHADIQALNKGDSLTDVFTVSALDGTTHTVTMTINGTDGDATIGGVDARTVTEDDTSPNLTASGLLTISDEDAGEEVFTVASNLAGTYGTLSINAAGSWTYTASNSQSAIQSLADGETLTDTITITSVDETAHAITITIQGTNDVPTIGGTSTATLVEDSQSPTLTATGTLTITDQDTGESAFVDESHGGSYGTLTIEEDGDWSYSAANNQAAIQSLGSGDSLTDTFSVQSTDSTTKSITITISGTDDAPVVSSIDLGDSDEDQPFTITSSALLASASDVDGDTLSVTSVTLDNSAYGSLTDNGDGTWTFNPTQDYNGENVSFTFIVSDGTPGDEATTSATLDITALNDRPDLVDDSSTGQASLGGSQITGASSVLANDSDVESDPLTVTNVNSQSIAQSGTTTIEGRYGTLEIAADGSWTYTPDSLDLDSSALDSIDLSSVDFSGADLDSDLVAYWSFDEASGTSAADSAAADTDANDGTLHGNARFSTSGLYGNSVEFDGSDDLVEITDSTELNIFTGNQNQRSISLGFQVDSGNDLSARQILFESGGRNDGYNLYIDSGTLYVGAWSESNSWNGEWLSIDLTGKDMTRWHQVSLVLDADSSSFKAYLDGVEFGSAAGSAMSNHGDEAAFGRISRKADGTYGGTKFHDGDALLQDYGFTGKIDEAYIYNRALSATEILALNYQHKTLTDRFVYEVSDGTDTSTATLNIDVNRTPEAQTGVLAVTEDGGTVNGQLSAIDWDDGDTLTFTEETGPSRGTLSITSTTGAYSYSPGTEFQDLAAGETEDVTFTYRVTDTQGDYSTATVTITVTGVNDDAVITDTGSHSVTEDAGSTLTTSGTLGISDADSGEGAFAPNTYSGTYGSVTINAIGEWSYSVSNSLSAISELSNGETLTDTIRLTTDDGTTYDLEVTINGTNDAPTLSTALTAQSVNEDQAFSFQVPANTFADAESNIDRYEASLSDGSVLPRWLNFDAATQTFYGTPDDGDVASLTVKVTAIDAEGLSADATFSLAINNVNDLPVPVFQEAGGLLSIEAENFHSSVSRSSNSWTEESKADASGGKVVATTDHDQAFSGNVEGSSPELTYEINFQTAGTYYIWIRGSSTSTSSDSVHIGLNGQYLNSASGINGFGTTGHSVWGNNNGNSALATITVSSAGTHQLNLWMDEDGFKADKIVLTTDSAYTPTGTGPAESEYVGSATQTATEEAAFSYTIPSIAFLDMDGDTPSLSASLQNDDPLPAWLSFDAVSRTFTGTPDDPDLGTIAIKVTASDDSGSTEVLFNLNVTPVNDAPDLTDDTDSGNATVAGTQVSGASSVLDNDNDIESDPLTVTDVNGITVAASGNTIISGDYGDLTIDADGNWTYNPVTPDIDSNLVGLWRFDGDALDSASADTIADDGTLRGTASTSSSGLSENGLTLSTDGDALVIPDSTEINDGTVTARTISLAFKVDPTNDLTARQVLFEEGDTVRGLNAYIDNGILYVGGYDTSISWSGTWYSVPVPAGNDWHNISLVLGSDTLSAYMDRTLLTTVVQDIHTGSKSLHASHAELAFGSLHGDTVYHDFTHNSANDDQISTTFIGQLDEARVYNRALTKQQINALHYEFETTSLTDRFTYTASDGTDSRTATLTIDVNRTPRALSGTLAATEDGSSIAGQLSAIDYDAGEILTYELVTDASEGSTVVNTDGSYTFSPGSDFQDLAAGATRNVAFTYRVTDLQGDSSTSTVTITVTGTNDAPVLQAQTLDVDENSSNGTTVGTVSATDVDVGDSVIIYSLADDAGGRFAINSSTGAITVADGTQLNHEDNGLHTITVLVSDGVNSSTKNYTVTINDINDAPTASDNTLTVDEDADLILTLAHFGYSDEDNDSLDKVQITDLPDSGTLQLSGVNVSANDEISRADIVAGNLVFRAAAHESGDSYASLDFRVHDGTVYSDSSYTLTFDVTAVADIPDLLTNNHQTDITDVEIYNASLGNSQNRFDGWSIQGTYSSLANGYELTDASMSRNFDTSAVNDDSYTVVVRLASSPGRTIDVYWDDQYVSTINPSGWGPGDSGINYTVQLPQPPGDSTEMRLVASGSQIQLLDVILTQHLASDPYYAIDEDHSASIDLTAQLVDTDSSESLAVSVSGLPANAVISDGGGNSATSTGATVDISGWDYASLSVTPPLHHDEDFTLTFSATATESSNSDAETVTQNVEIRVTPVNDPATFGGTDTGSVTEDSSVQASGTLTVSDVDDASEAAFQSVNNITGTYGSLSITSGGDWTYTIDNSRAAVQAIAAGATEIDTISVQSVDGTTKNISITVTGVNDAPVLPSPSLSIDENSSNSTSVGSVAATDVDTGASLTYTMTDNAGGRFQIDTSTGEITVADGSLLDHEISGSHSVTVRVSDGTATDTATYTITVNDINDAPVSSDLTTTINEDSSRILTSVDFAFSDEDSSGDTLSAVKITSLPAVGSLTLSGTTVSLNQEITIADINSGLLIYRPADHASGDGHAYFDFKVSDGSLFSASSNRITFNVTPVVTPPNLSVDGDVVITTVNFDGALPTGWTSENSLETRASGGSLGSSQSGTSILELDNEATGDPDALYYTIDTSQGHDHEISLWVKERSGLDGTDEIEIVWNGDVIETIDPTSSWGEVTITLPGLGLESTKLAIREVSDQNQGSGPLIDQITVTRLGADISTNPLYDYEINRNEDTWIPLDINAALEDTDGSETLAVSLAGVPAKFILTDGTNRVVSTGASIDISSWSNNDLTIIPFRDEVIDFTLTVTVTSTETANSQTSTVTKKIRVDMQDVPDLVLNRDSDSITESGLPENFIYVSDSQGRLAEINIETGYTDVIGTMPEDMKDIALGPDGVLYGITFGNLYTIDRTDASITAVTDGHSSNALTFGPDGTLYSTSGTSLVSIDVSTGTSTTLADIGYSSSGDLAYYNGKLYLAASHDGNSLVEIDVDNNYAVTVIGPIGRSNVYSLSTAGNNKLYGISGSDILEISTETGAGTVRAQLSGLSEVYGSSSVGEARSYIIGNVLTNDPDNSDFLVVTGVSAGDNTGLLYGVEDSNDGTLVTINPVTGVTTTIANTGVNMLELAQDSHGNLFGVDGTNLYSINTASGRPTQIGAHGLTDIQGLTIGNNGAIYAIESDGSLHTLNRNTGASTSLGQIGAVGADNSPTDLTFYNGNLYTVGHNSGSTANILIQIDLENALAATVVGTDMGILGTQGLAVGRDGELYAITTNQLYAVDTSSGSATLAHTISGLTDVHGLTSVLGQVLALDDDALVTPVGTQVTGRFGSLELFSDGSYRYLLDQSNAMVNSLNDGDVIYDVFTYSARNKDNHDSQITLTITINGSTDNAVEFTGTSGADSAMGRSGDDTLSGLGGTDTLTGDSGSDTITGDDGTSAMPLNIASSIITSAMATTIGIPTGLKGQIFDTSSIANLGAAVSLINSNQPTATFTSTTLNYGAIAPLNGSGDLQGFLGTDSSSLSGSQTMSATTFAMKLTGYVRLSAGSHSFSITADDGYRLSIGGQLLAEYTGSGGAIAAGSGSFTAAADALYEVEIIYWQGTGSRSLSVSSPSTLNFYQELPIGAEEVNGQDYYSLPTPEVTVSGLPAGGSLSAGTENDDGTWTVDASDLGTLGLSSTDGWTESVTVTLSNPSSEPAAPLNLHYTLDGVDSTTTSITDSSGNSNSGSTSAGDISTGVGDSPSGTHAHFDGSGLIVAGQSLDNSVTDATVSFWMKWDGSNSFMVPISFRTYNLWINGTSIGFNTSSTLGGFGTSDMWGRSITDLELAPDTNGLANEWHYVTAAFHHGDSHQSKLWIDGIEQTLSDQTGVAQVATNADVSSWPLAIGGEYFFNNSNYRYHGELDDVKLHEGSVSDNEALQLYLGAVNNDASEGSTITTHSIDTDQSDMIDGGAGNDILTGGYDSDHFIWHVGDDGTAEDPAEDTITDFQVGSGGDVLDLSNLLVDEENNELSDHLHFEISGSDTIVEVTPEADGSVTQKITLQNTDLSSLGSTDSDIITGLLNNGNLQVDQ